MRFLLHKGRHVVVADLPEDMSELEGDSVQVVGRVGLHSDVEGKARRGRPPSYAKPVKVADLELLDHSTVSEEHLTLGASLLEDASNGTAPDAAPEQ